MFANSSEKVVPKQSTQDVFCCQNLIVELNEQNEELWIGGSSIGEEILRPRLRASGDNVSVSLPYGIRSIPTLLGGGGVNQIRWEDKPGVEE